jgi:nicotinamidase-related amidase
MDDEVIYVVVGFCAGYPEVSSPNMSFSGIKSAGRFAEEDSSSAIHPAVTAQLGEPVVTKHRVGTFAETDLDMILQANGVATLILAGIATSGVMLSSVRYNSDANYRLVVNNCCSERDSEVHGVFSEKIFPGRQRDHGAADPRGPGDEWMNGESL